MSVTTTPDDREPGLLRPRDPAHHGGRILAAGRLAIHRHDRVAWPDPDQRARSVGDGLNHHDGRSAPGDAQPRTGLADAALAVLAGIARRHIAGIRIEMVE